jgi:glucan 1,3-beta-glucosidase
VVERQKESVADGGRLAAYRSAVFVRGRVQITDNPITVSFSGIRQSKFHFQTKKLQDIMGSDNATDMQWVRGVNLGGWLLLERFVTPYLFAISDCDLRGDFRFFPGQLGGPPPDANPSNAIGGLDKSNITLCKPHLPYPIDEYTLSAVFPSKPLARAYLERHWQNFVTYQDLQDIKDSGLDYVRVPLPHWVFGDIREGEPWVDGQWPFFVRLVSWCRKLGLQVWPDIHTAPGSQNGFDNSGQFLENGPTGKGWSDSDINVSRSIDVVKALVQRIKQEGLQDVVTGIGVLNEPFKDVPIDVMKRFNEATLSIIREGLGKDIKVFIPDLFNSTIWNDGYWSDPEKHANTILDSHYYHVFAEEPRALSPKQHIAYVCRYNARYTTGCCYQKDQDGQVLPSKGISRMIGEWSAAFDTLVVDKLAAVMDEIVSSNTFLVRNAFFFIKQSYF